MLREEPRIRIPPHGTLASNNLGLTIEQYKIHRFALCAFSDEENNLQQILITQNVQYHHINFSAPQEKRRKKTPPSYCKHVVTTQGTNGNRTRFNEKTFKQDRKDQKMLTKTYARMYTGSRKHNPQRMSPRCTNLGEEHHIRSLQCAPTYVSYIRPGLYEEAKGNPGARTSYTENHIYV